MAACNSLFVSFSSLLSFFAIVSIDGVVSQDVFFYFHDPYLNETINVTDRTARYILNTFYNTTIIIPGFNEGGQEPWIMTMTSLINKHVPSMNVLSVDFSSVSKRFQLAAVWKISSVADKIAKFILYSKLNLESTHLIGFDVGGHIAGMAGYQIGGDRLGRITGLDVSGAVFQRFLKFVPFTSSWRLTSDAAIFVDTIHTSSDPLRVSVLPLGYTDFYINWGIIQSECLKNLFKMWRCSHHLAHTYFSLTIINPTRYPANTEYNGKPVYMGWAATRAPGSYIVSADPTGYDYLKM